MQLDQCKNPVLHAAVSKLGGVRGTARAVGCSRGAVDQWLTGGGVYALAAAQRLVRCAWPDATPKQTLELLEKLARKDAPPRSRAKAQPEPAAPIPTLDELLGGPSVDQE